MISRFNRVPLSQVMTVDRNGIDPSNIDAKSEYLGLDNIGSDGSIKRGRTAGSADIRSTKHRFTPSHVLFGKLRPYLRKVAVPEFAGVCSTDILPLLPKTEVDQRYLLHWLRTDEFTEQATKESAGANLPRLSPNALLRFEIPLPPTLDEQKRIAAVLDKADALLRQRLESLQLTEQLLQSAFIDLFGDPGANPKGWSVENLGSLTSEGDSINYGVVQPGGDWPGGVPLVRAGDVANPNPDPSKLKLINPKIDAAYGRSRLNGGEVLIGCVGSVGATCIAPETWAGANIARAVARVNLRSDIPAEFVLQLLKTKALQNYFLDEIRVVAQPTLNIKQIKEAPIILPPPDLRDRFAEIYRRVIHTHSAKAESEAVSHNLFRALQQRAFGGELDLSRLKLEDEVKPETVAKVPEPVVVQGKYKRPGAFIAPPEIETQLLAFEEILNWGPGDSIPWSEDYFKYRTLSQVLRPPFNCAEILEKVHNDMPDATYEDVRRKLFQYLEEGILEQQFDDESREIVFAPRA